MDWVGLEKIEKKFDLFRIQTHPIPLNPHGLRANRTSPNVANQLVCLHHSITLLPLWMRRNVDDHRTLEGQSTCSGSWQKLELGKGNKGIFQRYFSICMFYITGFNHAPRNPHKSIFRVNEWEGGHRSSVSLHRLLLCQNETVKPKQTGDQNLSFLSWPLPQNRYVFVPFLQFHPKKKKNSSAKDLEQFWQQCHCHM
jgi:hypothetical protein